MLVPIIWALLLPQTAVQTLPGPQRALPSCKSISSKDAFRSSSTHEEISDEYNRNEGRVWPLREIEAVRKAYRDFDQSLSSGH